MSQIKVILKGIQVDTDLTKLPTETEEAFIERNTSKPLEEAKEKQLPILCVVVVVDAEGLSDNEHMAKIDELGQLLQDFDYKTEPLDEIFSSRIAGYEGFEAKLSIEDVRSLISELGNGIAYRLASNVKSKPDFHLPVEPADPNYQELAKKVNEAIKTAVLANLLEGFTYQDL